MKKYIFFLFCIIISCMASGQEVKNRLLELQVSPPKFMVSEDQSTPIQGNIYTFIQEHFSCPNPDVFNYGTSVIRFTITNEGNLTDFKVLNSVSWDIDEALIETLKKSDGMWQPGANDGFPVAMQQEVALIVKTGMSVYKAERLDFKVLGTKMYARGNKLMFVKHRPKRALRKYNYVVRLLPKEQSVFISRGMCHHALGNEEAAINDWKRVKELGGIGIENSAIVAFKNRINSIDLAKVMDE